MEQGQTRNGGTSGRRGSVELEQAQAELVEVARAIDDQRRRLLALARHLKRRAARAEVVDQAGGEEYTAEGWLADYLSDIAGAEVATAARLVAAVRATRVSREIHKHCRAVRRWERKQRTQKRAGLRLVEEIRRARIEQRSPMDAQRRFRELTSGAQPDGRWPFARRREVLAMDAARLGLTLGEYLDARGEIMVDDGGRLAVGS